MNNYVYGGYNQHQGYGGYGGAIKLVAILIPMDLPRNTTSPTVTLILTQQPLATVFLPSDSPSPPTSMSKKSR